MTPDLVFGLAGAGLIAAGLYALIVRRHLLRKILALNVIGNGVFLSLVALAQRAGLPDPVPHAMVLTGIVVAVSATAFAVALAVRVRDATGQAVLVPPADAAVTDSSRPGARG